MASSSSSSGPALLVPNAELQCHICHAPTDCRATLCRDCGRLTGRECAWLCQCCDWVCNACPPGVSEEDGKPDANGMQHYVNTCRKCYARMLARDAADRERSSRLAASIPRTDVVSAAARASENDDDEGDDDSDTDCYS